MNNYAIRSDQTELIDEPGLPFDDWSACLHELNVINTRLGGHAITIAGVKKLISSTTSSIVEIGCGGGDNLKAIYRALQRVPSSDKKSFIRNISFTGIDINEACTHFAQKNCCEIPGIKFISSDYQKVFFSDPPDIIFSSLFCHHFSDQQLVDMLVWLKKNTKAGFFINDLQRHPVAYHSIKWLTRLFSKSYLVKNDAPISVMRGFSRKEWAGLLQQAGISNYSIQWKWAFRFLIIVNNE